MLVQYRVIRLSELDGRRVLDSGHEGLIPFAPLMKPPEGIASRAWLRYCMHTAQTRAMAPPAKADFLAATSLLSGLVYTPETISDIISKEGMMDLIRESSFARYLTRQGVEQGLRESILAVLEVRFDLAASHPYAARIVNVDDAQRLKALHRAAVQVSGLDAFGQVLDEKPE